VFNGVEQQHPIQAIRGTENASNANNIQAIVRAPGVLRLGVRRQLVKPQRGALGALPRFVLEGGGHQAPPFFFLLSLPCGHPGARSEFRAGGAERTNPGLANRGADDRARRNIPTSIPHATSPQLDFIGDGSAARRLAHRPSRPRTRRPTTSTWERYAKVIALKPLPVRRPALRGETRADYGDPRNSFPERGDRIARTGIPDHACRWSTWKWRRARGALPIEGINFPGHFLLRLAAPAAA